MVQNSVETLGNYNNGPVLIYEFFFIFILTSNPDTIIPKCSGCFSHPCHCPRGGRLKKGEEFTDSLYDDSSDCDPSVNSQSVVL